MTLTVEAIYENGMPTLKQPLPLQEHEKVQVSIQPATSWVEETYGMCGFKGTAEEADLFAMDADLDFPPPAEEP